MLHPSYSELIASVSDKAAAQGEKSYIDSRYSVVIATAKRARQLTELGIVGQVDDDRKALSVAVEELNNYEIAILPPLDEEEEEEVCEAEAGETEETVEPAEEEAEDPEENE